MNQFTGPTWLGYFFFNETFKVEAYRRLFPKGFYLGWYCTYHDDGDDVYQNFCVVHPGLKKRIQFLNHVFGKLVQRKIMRPRKEICQALLKANVKKLHFPKSPNPSKKKIIAPTVVMGYIHITSNLCCNPYFFFFKMKF